MKHKLKKFYWGIFFVCAAVFIVLNQLGYVLNDKISFFSLAFTILLIPVTIESLVYKNFFGITFPLAFIFILNKKLLGVSDEMLKISGGNFWLIMLAALLLGIGLRFLFGDTKEWFRSQTADQVNGEKVYCNIKFGGSSKYIHSENFKRADIKCSFGGMEVYFDNARCLESAEINIDCSFGGVEMYVPRSWNVRNNIRAFAGAVEDRSDKSAKDGPVVTITGNVNFGGVEIIAV